MKKFKNNIVFTKKKSYKNLIFGNLSPKMRDPAFQINNTLKQYVDKKLNENITENIAEIDKRLFKHKKDIKKLKSFHGIKKRNNRNNNYTTTSNSKENLQLFSSLQNLSLSINNNKNKIIINDENKLFKNMTNKKRYNANKIFSYTKINNKINNTNNKELNNKSNQKITSLLSGKIPKIKAKNIFKKYDLSSSMKNIKIKNEDNNMNKTNIKEKNHYKTLFRFNSGDLNNIIDNNNNNLYRERCIPIKDNLENNYLSLTQRINYNSLNKIKNTENKNKNKKCASSKNVKKMEKNLTNTKYIKNKSKFQENKNNNKALRNRRESKILNNNNDTFCSNELNKININNIDNNNNDINNYYIPSSEKTESNNNSSTYNSGLNEQKILEGYELCWNLKNDYSKDIDISLISINNQKKSIIKNYKISSSINDNNNINNIYLNNIQNVNNITSKQDDLSNINNKAEYYSKLELLENENKMLKNEIKESKNRISILEYKIEELLDDKNSKENNECPQPTPYVIKYSKDIIPSKIKPKIEKNSQGKILQTINENLKEYSKNETKESDISNNRVTNKNEDELKNDNNNNK